MGCGTGQCGACNVIIDGKLVRTCTLKMKRIPDNAAVTTLEGIGAPEHLHPLQMAWMYHGGAQCGFCTPGFIVSAKCLLDNNPAPTRAEVRDWFPAIATPAAVPATSSSSMPSWTPPRFCAANRQGISNTRNPWMAASTGSRRPRPNAVAKVTGTHDYGDDPGLKMPPNTLHLALAQAKVSHANIKGIDTSEAEKMPASSACSRTRT
ncbi:MAG: 2Fe-2S iron-sulfur cluster-binding protein [Bilophila sp.]